MLLCPLVCAFALALLFAWRSRLPAASPGAGVTLCSLPGGRPVSAHCLSLVPAGLLPVDGASPSLLFAVANCDVVVLAAASRLLDLSVCRPLLSDCWRGDAAVAVSVAGMAAVEHRPLPGLVVCSGVLPPA